MTIAIWATADGRLGIEKPISTLTALLIMSDPKTDQSHEARQVPLIWSSAIKPTAGCASPQGPISPPCGTVRAALCRKHGGDPGQTGPDYLVGQPVYRWRLALHKFLFGKGPETNFSNPGVTLLALDAFRCLGTDEVIRELDTAVETLLDHWTVRVPTGPCHYGMGTLFMQVEYPFLRYNLFYYVYVLSFYPKARKDGRFKEALQALTEKVDSNGQLSVERPFRKLAKLDICQTGQPSLAATARYREILKNLEQ